MGVDTEIRLPPNVRLRDVAVVMGILAGLPKQWYNGYIIVDGAKPRPGCSPETPEIELKGKMVDGKEDHSVLFFYEGDHNGKWRSMSPPSTPFWQAVGRGLVKFFGGELDLNDCDSKDCDYKVKPRKNISPCNNPEWNEFWKDVDKLKPVRLGRKQ
jgi:hypothetical protein